MIHILTLIAGKGKKLDNTHLEIVKKLSDYSSINWLSPAKAVDLFFHNDKIYNHMKDLRIAFDKEKIDFILQVSDDSRRKKLLCADMDGTLIEQECLDELAKYIGVEDEVSSITRSAMCGEIDFNTSLTKRMALLKDTPVFVLDEVYNKLTLTRGAEQLVKTMSENGASCVLISGGFTFFADKIAKHLGCERAYSNVFDIVDNKLTGRVIPPIVNEIRKKEILELEQKRMGIDKKSTMAVGDGANDIPMLLNAGMGISFKATDATEKAAAHNIRHSDLKSLLYIQGYSDDEISYT